MALKLGSFWWLSIIAFIGFPAQFSQNCIQLKSRIIQFRANLNDHRDQDSKR